MQGISELQEQGLQAVAARASIRVYTDVTEWSNRDEVREMGQAASSLGGELHRRAQNLLASPAVEELHGAVHRIHKIQDDSLSNF